MKTVITIHGVRSKQKDNWQDDFDDYIKDSGRTDIKHIKYKYGWIPAFYSIIPFIRRYHTNRFRKWLKQYNLLSNIYIVAHSFGTFIGFHGSNKVDKLILFGSILHCREDFNGIVPDRIKEIHNFHSLEDDVCRLNPIGHSGTGGFRCKNTKTKKWHRRPYKNKKIINHRLFLPEHNGYFPSKFSDILELIK